MAVTPERLHAWADRIDTGESAAKIKKEIKSHLYPNPSRERAALCVKENDPALKDLVTVVCRGVAENNYTCGAERQVLFRYVVKCCQNNGGLYRCRTCSNLALRADPTFQAKLAASWTPERLVANREMLRGLWSDDGFRQKISASASRQARTPAGRAQRSLQAKAAWADPKYRAKQALNPPKPRWKTHEQFIADAMAVHGDAYDYGEANYEHCERKITLICKMCGCRFRMIPAAHLRGSGCPNCPTTISKGHQKIIDWLIENEIPHVVNDHMIIGKELDIYVPAAKLAIEYNGVYWHSYGETETRRERAIHATKRQLCAEQDIELLQFLELEPMSFILGTIGSRLAATRTSVPVDSCKCEQLAHFPFGADKAISQHSPTTWLGLQYLGSIVAAIGVETRRTRAIASNYTEAPGVSVAGGLDKLLGFITKTADFPTVYSHDQRFGHCSLTIGTLLNVMQPRCFWLKYKSIWSSSTFLRTVISDVAWQFAPELSRLDNLFKLRYRRLWDAGHQIYSI